MYFYVYIYVCAFKLNHDYIPTYLASYLHTYLPTYIHTYSPLGAPHDTYKERQMERWLHTHMYFYIYTLHTHIYIYIHTEGLLCFVQSLCDCQAACSAWRLSRPFQFNRRGLSLGSRLQDWFRALERSGLVRVSRCSPHMGPDLPEQAPSKDPQAEGPNSAELADIPAR